MNDIGQRTGVARTGSAFPSSSAPAVSWNYDSLGQVESSGWGSANENNDEHYQYDAIGNRITSFTGPAEPESMDEYVANTVNEYTATPFERATSYDAVGNLTAGVVPGAAGAEFEDEDNPDFAAATNLKRDGENRLVSITVDGVTITYDYDYLGRRISRTRFSDSLEFHYAYDGWNLIAQKNRTSAGTISLARTYTWGLDLSGTPQGAGGVGGLLVVGFRSSGANQDDYYRCYDGNGNVCQYLDSGGVTDVRYEYDSFGRLVVNEGTSVKEWMRFRFSTKPRDYNRGLYYYGYRYYDPVTGRWPSKDPIEERGGMNLYTFVGNNGVWCWGCLGLSERTLVVTEDSEANDGELGFKVRITHGKGVTTTNENPVANVQLTTISSVIKYKDGSTKRVQDVHKLDASLTHLTTDTWQVPFPGSEDKNEVCAFLVTIKSEVFSFSLPELGARQMYEDENKDGRMNRGELTGSLDNTPNPVNVQDFENAADHAEFTYYVDWRDEKGTVSESPLGPFKAAD